MEGAVTTEPVENKENTLGSKLRKRKNVCYGFNLCRIMLTINYITA